MASLELLRFLRFEWGRETREARKRARGSIPAWADPVYLHDDEREVRRLLSD